MVKRNLLFLVLFLPFLIFGQETVEETESGFNMGGGAGAVMIGDQTYSRIRLMPELTLGKFGIGLDIDILIDSDGNIREEDWNDWQDYMNKIYYLRYGHRGDTFFGRIGGFPSYTLGPGLVMNNYSNMLSYPEFRQIGLQLGGKLPFSEMELEGFTSNITKNEILAGRATIKPLMITEIPLLNNIKLGTSIAYDKNQIKGLIDSDNDDYPDFYDDFPHDDSEHNEVDANINYWEELYTEIHGDTLGFNDWFYGTELLPRNTSFADLGKDDIMVAGVDYELPLVETDLFKLSNYGEVAKIMDHNMGLIFPGFYAKFLIFHANLEFRYYQDDFIPEYFDHLYDDQRVVIKNGVVSTKEELIKNALESKGWYGKIRADLFKLINLTIAYEDMYGENDTHRRSLWGTLALEKTFIPKLSTAQISYFQVGVDKIEQIKTPQAYIVGKVGYSVSGNTELVAQYQERYQDLNGDDKIEGKEETLKTFSVGVEFRF